MCAVVNIGNYGAYKLFKLTLLVFETEKKHLRIEGNKEEKKQLFGGWGGGKKESIKTGKLKV